MNIFLTLYYWLFGRPNSEVSEQNTPSEIDNGGNSHYKSILGIFLPGSKVTINNSAYTTVYRVLKTTISGNIVTYTLETEWPRSIEISCEIDDSTFTSADHSTERIIPGYFRTFNPTVSIGWAMSGHLFAEDMKGNKISRYRNYDKITPDSDHEEIVNDVAVAQAWTVVNYEYNPDTNQIDVELKSLSSKETSNG